MTYPITTGLADLDALSGGGLPGELWVLAGPAEVGVSDLALGFARAAAFKAQQAVRWLSTSEEPEAVRRRALAAQSRTPIEALDSGDPTGRLAEAESALDAAWLDFSRVRPQTVLREAQVAVEGHCDLLVLDRLDATNGDVLRHLKRMATEGGSWVVAVASDHGLDRQAFWRSLNGIADVLVWVERDDVLDPTTDRLGEADLVLMRQRRRKAIRTVAYQKSYRRFVGMVTP